MQSDIGARCVPDTNARRFISLIPAYRAVNVETDVRLLLVGHEVAGALLP